MPKNVTLLHLKIIINLRIYVMFCIVMLWYLILGTFLWNQKINKYLFRTLVITDHQVTVRFFHEMSAKLIFQKIKS